MILFPLLVSTILVANGNNPSDGSQRTVANHFGIIYSDTLDCDGTVIRACQGGRVTGSRDGAVAFCVDSRCPGGDGLGVACNDGQYSTGDCTALGLVCGTDSGGGACIDPNAPVRADARWEGAA